MSIELTITSITFLLMLMITIIILTKQEKISVKYSLVWLFPCLTLLVFTLVPGFLNLVTKLLGFQTASNMVITLLVAFLMIITIALTVIVSKQNDRIRLLIQEVSLLKEKK